MQVGPANAELVWLFNLTADPNERVNLAPSMPDTVLEFQTFLLSQPQIDQSPPPSDPRACPPLLNHTEWMPWLPDPKQIRRPSRKRIDAV